MIVAIKQLPLAYLATDCRWVSFGVTPYIYPNHPPKFCLIFSAQIGQYYAKMLPAYTGSHSSAAGESIGSSSPNGGAARRGASGNNTSGDGVKGFNNGLSALRVTKAWEVGQRAAQHFLAARAYFAPFEHGPTSVILALDLCNLYLFLAEMGGTAAGGGDDVACATTAIDSPSSASSSAGRRDGFDMTVPIPSLPSGTSSKRAGETAVSDHPGLTTTGAGTGRHRLRPTSAVRLQCLEGALRSLLDTRSVFVDAGVDLTAEVVAAAATATNQQEQRLRRLLELVTERLPKVLQALVRSSVEMESSSSSSPTATFKAMYRTSLMAMREGGGGARSMLSMLATEYGALGGQVAHGD